MHEAGDGKRAVFKDPSLAEAFNRDGYVIVDALDNEEVESLRRRIMPLLDPALPINDPQGALYGSLFDARCRDEGGEITDQAIGPLLDRLLVSFRYEGGYIVAKRAGSGRLAMHQHQPVTRDIFEPAVHCWLSLDDTAAGTGALRVVRGSHGITRHVQSFDSAPYFAGFESQLEQDCAEVLEVRAGQAVIFERSLLHGSEPNTADRPRLRLLGTAIPAESALCILAEPVAGEFHALEVGTARIDPDLYCIARENRAALPLAGRVDNRNGPMLADEFAELIASGLKIGPGFDPIDTIRERRRVGRGL